MSWEKTRSLAAPLRYSVFVEEQGVPEELEWDELDATAMHAIAMDVHGNAIGTGRLLSADAKGTARIGRMAVHRDRRRSGIGKAILNALLNEAQSRGDSGIALHAQLAAREFYATCGFIAVGAVFMEAGISHVKMHLMLHPRATSTL